MANQERGGWGANSFRGQKTPDVRRKGAQKIQVYEAESCKEIQMSAAEVYGEIQTYYTEVHITTYKAEVHKDIQTTVQVCAKKLRETFLKKIKTEESRHDRRKTM